MKRPLDEVAYEAHLAEATRRVTKPLPARVWDSCPVTSGPRTQEALRKIPFGAAPLLSHPSKEPVVDQPAPPPAAQSAKVVRPSAASWDDKLSDGRPAAIAKWAAIVRKGGREFGVFAAWEDGLEAEAASGLPASTLEASLRDAFGIKASNTLHGRAGPVMRYICFCDRLAMPAFPETEAKLNAFVTSCDGTKAPTFARSFVCSVAFMGHILALKDFVPSLSRRVTGAAALQYARKAKAVQKPPLTAGHVRLLERILDLSRQGPERFLPLFDLRSCKVLGWPGFGLNPIGPAPGRRGGP